VARKLPASAALAKTIITRRLMTFSFGMDGAVRHDGLVQKLALEESKRRHRDRLKMGEPVGRLH
jgi:hypothetical protein